MLFSSTIQTLLSAFSYRAFLRTTATQIEISRVFSIPRAIQSVVAEYFVNGVVG
jgi:hypothetical protein